MLRIYTALFNRLNQDIPYVVWKACHEIKTALNGLGDIDILIDSDYQKQFQKIMRAQGFVHAEFSALKFPFVCHFYGCDEETGKICHLHVYYKIVTGESHLKSYHLPLENEIIANRFLNSMGVYETAYRDQALIYSMRHYMKRASLIGYLFWAYEKKDYLDEYNYISNGLNSTKRGEPLLGENDLRSEFDFQSLDMGMGISGYRKAKNKIVSISGFRRFNALEAFLKGLYFFGARLSYKAFRVRKRLDNGLVLAISGVDGSGKSSMVQELHGWLGKNFDVDMLHLGKPSPTLLTISLRPLLFMYRVIKGKNRENLDDSEDYSSGSKLKKKNGFIWGLRYLALAYERHKLARIAQKRTDKGKIVFCDRYPTISFGKMDSPRIGSGGSWIVEKMRHFELKFYEQLPKADGLLFLDVSMEEAIKRNRKRIKKDKETDDGIAFRHKDNQGLSFGAEQVFIVDANRDYDSVLKSLKSISWKFLLVKNQ